MNGQIAFKTPKEKKDTTITMKLGYVDIVALERGMAAAGETIKSSYIRRLIQEAAKRFSKE
jgi:hypothetical protein